MTVEGLVAPGYEAVRDVFELNFTERGEVGAAFAAVRDGEPVVDLWGGYRDPDHLTPWTRDTLTVVFSGTKGLVALCLLMLVDRSLLDPDAPVSHYWPEFAAAGKADMTVSMVASHRARLPGIRTVLKVEDVLDDVRMAELLAAQAPERDPRAGDVYHAFTFGWLCGELIRRVDGRSVGRFFAEEVAMPLGVEIWIGLPAVLEPRVSTLRYAEGWGAELFDEQRLANDELLRTVWANPPLLMPSHLPFNSQAFHAAEIPGAGAIATARSMARLYGCLARGGELDGIRLLSDTTLDRGRAYLTSRREPLANELNAFGIGFELQTQNLPLGPPPNAFGHGGAGGSQHGAWPSERVGFSYCMNHMRDDAVVDPRSQSLLTALHEALHR